jgi:hypothetical protein
MIPKIIYYTWISDKPLPDRFKPYIENWKKVMPEYEIRPITLSNYVVNDWTRETVRRKKFTLAGHFSRVQRLYETGGIYFDIDIDVEKPFDDLLSDDFFLGCEDANYVNNACFGSVKGHPFLRECMEYMLAYDINNSHIELETGPRMFTNLMIKRGWLKGNTTLKIGDVKVYDNRYFYPYKWNEKYRPDCVTPETHAVHRWAHTWGDIVSVIISCYKQAEFLSDAIESVLDQTYPNVEIIVVNDESPDNTMDVAKKYPDVILVNKIKNGGLGAARNTGIRIARGKYIITLDADDKLRSDYIMKTIGVNDIVGTLLITFGADNNTVWIPPNQYPTAEQEFEFNHITCCALFKKEIWEKIGGYDESMGGFEDWDFWIRATHEGYKISVIMEPLMLYRKHGDTMATWSQTNKEKLRSYMLNKYMEMWKNGVPKNQSSTGL